MNGNIDKPETAATKLRRRIESPGEILLCPGVYDGFSARIALGVGFDALYMVRIFVFSLFLFTSRILTET